jgi:hypothetical protein
MGHRRAPQDDSLSIRLALGRETNFVQFMTDVPVMTFIHTITPFATPND